MLEEKIIFLLGKNLEPITIDIDKSLMGFLVE